MEITGGGKLPVSSGKYRVVFSEATIQKKETGKVRTMSRQKAIKLNEKLLEEAALWHARISDDLAGEDVWLAFTEWLEADETHRLSYDRVEELTFELDEVVEPVLSALAEDKPADKASTDNSDNVVSLAAWRWGNRNVWGGVAALAAMVMLVVANLGVFTSPEVVTQEFFTGYGEQQLVQLDDGSSIHLNTNSRLKVTLSEDERRTQLAYGEALFSVAKDNERPFFVAVGDQQVRVVGTQFNILRHEGTVTVTVSEGIVDVSAIEPREDAQTSRLTVGKQLVHEEGATGSLVRDVEPENIIAWESGVLTYEDAPLVYTIKELGRYFERPIEIRGDISHITFSGVLNVRDQEAVLMLLEDTLPIKITQSSEMIIVTANN